MKRIKQILMCAGLAAVMITSVLLPVHAENTVPQEKPSWEGVYYHDDGNQGEYYFLKEVNGNSISGAEIAINITGEFYDVYSLNWTIDSAVDMKASSHWQSGRYTHYQRLEDRILEDESEYRMGENQKEYLYICSIEEAPQKISHPNLNEALILLDNTAGAASVGTATAPFYGIWCTASHDKADCDRTAADLNGKGFPANVYETTDWSNLNPVHWYVVSAGEYGSEAQAAGCLAGVQGAGYGDAYVKYTGEYQK
ncbi:MAG: SPOR domain-containing protein [Eubacteriales bacterium]|nr:SPOR domain-containing protein [Eubacteriales bacterium]